MKITSEAEMLQYGRDFAGKITLPAVVELVGDVGVGKTTFTRGLAEGLGIAEPITSPSFTISKRYAFSQNGANGELVHYDFYRLDDPGIMREEIEETLSMPNTVTVVEWGESVVDLLPDYHYRLEISLNLDGSREVQLQKGVSHENVS